MRKIVTPVMTIFKAILSQAIIAKMVKMAIMEWYDMATNMVCPDGNREKYIGETSRNLYTRSTEHLKTFRSGDQSSFIIKHQISKHNGVEPVFKAKVTARTRDCLSRQVREAVLIRRSQVPVLNGKSEWHQPALYRVQMEMERG